MNGVLGVTTEPPLLTDGKQAADWLAGRNVALCALLRHLGLWEQEYGVSLSKLRDLVIASDELFRETLAFNRAKADGLHHVLAEPAAPSANVKIYSTMSASQKARLRLVATLAPMTEDGRYAAVEFSTDDIGMFCMADPGLVADYAAVLVSRYIGV